MTSLSRAGIGFAFTVNTVDELTRFIVNVYGNDDVGVPLARNMNAIDDVYLDRFGIENLVIPISVSEAKEIRNDDGSYVVDVVVHSKVTSRCCNSKHPLHHKYVTDMIKLAVEWVQQECGVKLQVASCKLLGLPMYYSTSTSETNDNVERMSQNVMEYLTKMAKNTHISQTHQGQESNVCLPPELVLEPKSQINNKIEPVNHDPRRTSNTNPSTVSNSVTLESSANTIAKDNKINKAVGSSDIIKKNNNESDTKSIRKTLVQEVIKPLQIKKGFLTETKKPLYGNEGSHEGEGKVYDELSHIPQSLRERCQVIDLRPDVQRSSSTVLPEASTSKHKIINDTNCKSETISNITLTPKEIECQHKEQQFISLDKENKLHTMNTTNESTINSDNNVNSVNNSVSSNIIKHQIVKITSTASVNSVIDETMKSPIELMREKCEKVKSNKWVLHSIKEERGKCVMRLVPLKHVSNISDVCLLTNNLCFEVDDFHYDFSKPADVSGVLARFDKHENVLKLIWPLNTY